MTTIQIDDQVFATLQRAAAHLNEPSPNKVLRRILLTNPILASLPDAPWPSAVSFLPAAPLENETTETVPTRPERIGLEAIPPPRFERAPEPPPRLPTWHSLGEVLTPRTPSVVAQSGGLPPGLRQALDVVHLIVRHRVPRPEAIRRVEDLRRAAGASSDGPRLRIGEKEFDRMIRQRGRTDLRAILKDTFPGHDVTIDGFFDELSASRKKATASA
ncbi:MAG: hypothetical protein Rubg2KO_02300 [Rubricoccaceae bacterium]